MIIKIKRLGSTRMKHNITMSCGDNAGEALNAFVQCLNAYGFKKDKIRLALKNEMEAK